MPSISPATPTVCSSEIQMPLSTEPLCAKCADLVAEIAFDRTCQDPCFRLVPYK